MSARLAHVCLHTTDLQATEQFYGLLGLRRQFDFQNRQGELVGFYLKFGNLSFIEVILVGALEPGGVLRHFAIEVPDVAETEKTLRAAGVAVTERHLAGDRNWMITCHDPNGVFIEIQQYTADSMQRVGGVCEVDYYPGGAA